MKQECPHCRSKNTKKNGHTHYGKQNNQCNDCNRQFVEGGQEWFISDSTKEIIDNLLLERISIAGISRVVKVSQTWLQDYIKEKYKECPDDLNVDLSLPEQTDYLDARFDEEIERLEKKSLNSAPNIHK